MLVPASPFEQQVRRHRDRLYGLACYLLRDDAEAADVTQDVLLRFWKHRANVEAGKERAWLLRTTRNACLDVLRKRTMRRGVLTVSTDGVHRARDRRPGPDAQAEASDFQRHLQRALQTLDEPYRSLVVLREIQALKYREIAEVLEMPMNQVKVYLHRARKRLRKTLTETTDYEIA